jgi:ATP-binding cassette subfamily C protein
VRLDDELCVDRVNFGYGDTRVLTDVSLSLRRGQTVAVVGPSGAGKSTLADVVLGLLIPQDGRVLVDGRALTRESHASWRAQIGYVPQETFLFHDTIRVNLQWAAPDATEQELWEALRSASADFVQRLPSGLDTVVGDRGVLLSGGERQRVALARALLRKPRLLVLDEATSSLDPENERAIQQAIDGLHGRAAILVITHRLPTVRHADLIYVLDEGHIVEFGTWAELVARPGRFRKLCRAQGLEPDDHPFPPSSSPAETAPPAAEVWSRRT